MKKVFLVLFISLFMAMSVMASENVLQSVQIEPCGDTYNIVLISDNSVAIKKTVQAPNRILLSLKGIRASKTLSTVYKNVSNVDNIIVEPYGVDGLNIMFQADNASNAKVTFDSLVSSIKVQDRANPKKEISLSAPMNTYTPIYPQESDSEKSALSNVHLGGILAYGKAMLSGSNTTTLLTFGLFGLIFLMGLKLIRKRDENIGIGLSQSLADYKDSVNTKTVPNMLGSGSKIPLSKPYTSPVNNYNGIKAYQNSTKSPYMQQIQQNGRMSSNTANRMASMAKRNLMADSVQPMQSRVNTQPVRQPQVSTMSKPKMQPKMVDNMKFLESMSQIYEKSGRPDLASGIRSKLSKISN